MTFGEQSPGYLFLIGTGRSGSTMIEEILARHESVGWVSNFDAALPALDLKGRLNHFINDHLVLRRLSTRDRLGSVRKQSRVHFGPSESYGLLERQISKVVSISFRDLRAEDATPWIEERVRRFFVERARVQGKPVFMHKFTGWPRAAFLHRVFPDARFVHVVRDGRAVANSLLQMPWWKGYAGPPEWGFGPLPENYQHEWEENGCSFVALAGIEWKLMLDAAEVARATIPDELWLDIKYEDFLEQPDPWIKRMLSFVGLEWSSKFEKRFVEYSLSQSRRQAYKRDLSSEDVAVLERILEKHLERWNYGLASALMQDKKAIDG